MKLVTATQMQAIDKAAVEKYGIPSLDLMERAGKGIAALIIDRFPKKGIVAVVVGKGNNGGDGLVSARYLKKAGFDVELYLVSPWTEFSNDARVNWDRLAGLDVKVIELKGLERASCIVDAIFGTGLNHEITGRYKTIIEFINSLSKPVVAVDIPSGLSSETGQPMGTAIRAKITATLGLAKVGLFVGTDYSREVQVIDIGIPPELVEKADTGYHLITPELFSSYLGPRKSDSHKGEFGHVLVVGGSLGKMGAGLLAARGALRSGAGLVTYALPEAAFAKFDTRSPEIMYEPFGKDSIQAARTVLKDKDVLVIGPGIGTADETKAFISDIIKRAAVPAVIDADALNCLVSQRMPDFSRGNIVLTPHPGEMSRLCGLSTKDIQEDRVSIAKSFAKNNHIYLVLKGHRTIVATPIGAIFINPTGNPGMATAGSGDVLAGVIGGLVAQKLPMETAIIAAVYLHGMAGDLAALEIGERGLIASDIINNIPKAIKKVIWAHLKTC